MLQNEKLVVDEFLEKVAAASRKVLTCSYDCSKEAHAQVLSLMLASLS